MSILNKLGQAVALKKNIPSVMLLVSLCLAPIIRADIALNFVYDPVSGATTATYFGSWANWTGAIQDSGASGGISPAGIAHYGATSSYINTSVFSGAAIPWTVNTTTPTYSGDAWGFSSGRVIAPSNYTANASISGSLTFAGLDLTALGFTPTEIANGGTIGSGNFIVHWSASSPIPEPSTYATILGAGALGIAIIRRRRTCNATRVA